MAIRAVGSVESVYAHTHVRACAHADVLCICARANTQLTIYFCLNVVVLLFWTLLGKAVCTFVFPHLSHISRSQSQATETCMRVSGATENPMGLGHANLWEATAMWDTGRVVATMVTACTGALSKPFYQGSVFH